MSVQNNLPTSYGQLRELNSLEAIWFGGEAGWRLQQASAGLEEEFEDVKIDPLKRTRVYIEYRRFQDAIDDLQRVLDGEPVYLQARFLLSLIKYRTTWKLGVELRFLILSPNRASQLH